MSETPIIIYTDGACSGNPGPGGWGAVLSYKGAEKECSGFVPESTNNRMELQAVIQGLRAVKKTLPIEIYTDSRYVQQGITEWIHNWKKKNWRTAGNKPVKNQDLWQNLDAEIASHRVTFHWVKGHAGHPGNERADFLATNAIENHK